MSIVNNSLTCFQGINIGILCRCFPTSYHENTLTYYISSSYVKPRITPNGSLQDFGDYAEKWLHPP